VSGVKPAGEALPLLTSEAATLAQQKMSDEQASKKFSENGHGSFDTYTSHYDPVVNVCYIRVHSFSAQIAVFSYVFYDAFGGRTFNRRVLRDKPRSHKGFLTLSQSEKHGGA
jgi:hypothetical protein